MAHSLSTILGCRGGSPWDRSSRRRASSRRQIRCLRTEHTPFWRHLTFVQTGESRRRTQCVLQSRQSCGGAKKGKEEKRREREMCVSQDNGDEDRDRERKNSRASGTRDAVVVQRARKGRDETLLPRGTVVAAINVRARVAVGYPAATRNDDKVRSQRAGRAALLFPRSCGQPTRGTGLARLAAALVGVGRVGGARQTHCVRRAADCLAVLSTGAGLAGRRARLPDTAVAVPACGTRLASADRRNARDVTILSARAAGAGRGARVGVLPLCADGGARRARLSEPSVSPRSTGPRTGRGGGSSRSVTTAGALCRACRRRESRRGTVVAGEALAAARVTDGTAKAVVPLLARPLALRGGHAEATVAT